MWIIQNYQKKQETDGSNLAIKTDTTRKDWIFDFQKFKMLRSLERYHRWYCYIKLWAWRTIATEHVADDF